MITRDTSISTCFIKKNEALNAFKVFKAEVEKQCGKPLKIVRLTKVGSIMEDTQKIDKRLDHLRSFFKKMRSLPNIPCLVLRTRMALQKEEIEL